MRHLDNQKKGSDPANLGGNAGQVGIGTLIIFISMVLVAAVASVVLLNTGGLLKEQATTTGERSTAQVSSSLEIKSITGNVTTSENVDWLNFSVSLRAGSRDIDLANTTIEYVDKDISTILKYSPSSADSSHFTVTRIQDDDSSLAEDDPVLNNREDTVEVHIHVSDIDDPLEESEKVEIGLQPPSGSQSIFRPLVPQSVSGRSVVSLQ